MDNEEQRDHAEEQAVRAQYESEYAPEVEAERAASRTAAATRANVRRRLERNAQELSDSGWFVISPEDLVGKSVTVGPLPVAEGFVQPLSDDVVGVRSVPWA